MITLDKSTEAAAKVALAKLSKKQQVFSQAPIHFDKLLKVGY